MSAKLLEGKTIAAQIVEELKKECAAFRKKPKLVAVQIGENTASQVYIRSQKKRAEEIGIDYELKILPGDAKQDVCDDTIVSLNRDRSVNGIILQLPVPEGIDQKRLIQLIDPAKDAEGMHPGSLGNIMLGKWAVAPCTASACLALIESTGVKIYGKEVVIVGHSEIVGKPLALMLLSKFATTTVCHIATGERGLVPEHVKRAEILVVAVGKAGLIKGEWVRDGAIVIDVGINKVGDKIVGDVEFETASQRAGYITRVPGGVGPLTVVMLMKNVISSYAQQTSDNLRG